MEQEFKFSGFISYSQKDRKWARKIHKALEAYKLPSHLGGHKISNRKLGKFFRDEEDLSGSPSLDAALTGAIDSSRTLIVICSPNAVASTWVDKEIAHFKRRGAAARVLPVIVSGQPDATDSDEQCFPPTLFHHVHPDGTLGERHGEPLGPDVRKETFARLITRLAAGILELDFDALWQREKRRIFRRRLIAAAATVSLAMLGGSIALYGQANLERTESEALASAAQQALEANNQHTALRLATLAIRPGWASEVPVSSIQAYQIISKRLPPVFRVDHQPLVERPRNYLSDSRQNAVDSAKLLASDTQVLTSGFDPVADYGYAKLWDIETAQERRAFHQRNRIRWALPAAHETRLLAIGAENSFIWNLETGAELSSFKHEWVNPPLFFADGVRALTWSDSDLRITNVLSGEILAEFDCECDSRSVQFFKDQTRILVRTGDKALHVLDARTGEQLFRMMHEDTVWGMRPYASDTRILSWSEDQSVRIWDAGTGEPIRRIDYAVPITDAFLVSGSTRLLTFGEFVDPSLDGPTTWGLPVNLRNIETQTDLISEHFQQGVSGFKQYPDDSRIAIWSRDGELRTWDTVTGTEFAPMSHGAEIHEAGVGAISGEMRFLTRTGPVIGVIRIWDAISGEELVRFRHDLGVSGATLFADNTRLLSWSMDGTARIWDVESGVELARMDHEDQVNGARLLDDQRRVLTWSSDGSARIWDIGWNLQERELVPLALDICEDRLARRGEATGLNEMGDTRRATRIVQQSDVDLVPLLSDRVGEDACRSQERGWYRATRWVSALLPRFEFG